MARFIETTALYLGIASAVISIPVDYPQFEKLLPEPLFANKNYLWVSAFAFCVFGGSKLFTQWKMISPSPGLVSLSTLIRTYWPKTLHRVISDLAAFQQCLLTKKKMRASYQSIRDVEYINVVVTAILSNVQKIFEALTGTEVCVQLFSFERTDAEDPEITDVTNASLTRYCAVNPTNAYNQLKARTHDEKYKLVANADPHQLKRLTESHTDAHDLHYHSGFNKVLHLHRHNWVSNKLHKQEEKGEFFTNSRYYKSKYYDSMAVFVVSGQAPAADSLTEMDVFGLLVVDSVKSNCFESRLAPIIGKYLASRIHHFIRNSEREFDARSLKSP